MIKSIKILCFLTLTQFSSYGQVGLIEKVYHKHFQICNFIGTTEEDLVLNLKKDSTITFTIYRTDYKDQYNSILRQIYFGTFSIVGDSIKAKFTNQTSLIKNKSGISQTNTNVKLWDTAFTTKISLQYPPSMYLVKEDELISTNMFFPVLPISTSSKAFSLDYKFNNWDKVASKKEIFGLSD